MTSNPIQFLRKAIPSTPSSAAAQPAAQEVAPNPNEVLMVYPSYSRQTDTGVFEVDVRGWLFLEGSNSRKSRILNATARKIAGARQTPASRRSSSQSLADCDVESHASEMAADYLDDELTASTTTRSVATDYSLDDKSCETLRTRLSGFLTKPLSNRQIKITFSGLTDSSGIHMKEFHTETNSSGRFSLRLTLYKRPTVVSVEANEYVVSFEPVINVDRYGVSVISDIDDTVKITGILGSKRELFRNVFVYDYEKIAIEGVKEWYRDLSELGVQFHYVSNSPWQLYPIIQAYLHNAGLPRGSMHLKEYSGFLLNGLFEPAGERKKKNLYKILKDFPDRKFLLIGDSGEGDLEAYIDVACQFPHQVLAICIRDVTMPDLNGEDWELSQFRRNMIPRPDEIDMYESKLLKSSKAKQSVPKSRIQPTKSMSSLKLTDEMRPLSITQSNSQDVRHSLEVSRSRYSFDTRPIDLGPRHSIGDSSIFENKSSSKKSVIRRKPVNIAHSNDETEKVIGKNISTTAAMASSTNTLHAPVIKVLQVADLHNVRDDNMSQSSITTVEKTLTTSVSSFSDAQKPADSSTNTSASSIQKKVTRKPISNPSNSTHIPNEQSLRASSSYFAPISRPYTFDQSMSQNHMPAHRVHPSTSTRLRTPSEDFELPELCDKRTENWKRRVLRARLQLPPEIKLCMWKTGKDVRSESVDYARREMMKIINV
jgi:phosphatidate phosphatase APP1